MRIDHAPGCPCRIPLRKQYFPEWALSVFIAFVIFFIGLVLGVKLYASAVSSWCSDVNVFSTGGKVFACKETKGLRE